MATLASKPYALGHIYLGPDTHTQFEQIKSDTHFDSDHLLDHLLQQVRDDAQATLGVRWDLAIQFIALQIGKNFQSSDQLMKHLLNLYNVTPEGQRLPLTNSGKIKSDSVDNSAITKLQPLPQDQTSAPRTFHTSTTPSDTVSCTAGLIKGPRSPSINTSTQCKPPTSQKVLGSVRAQPAVSIAASSLEEPTGLDGGSRKGKTVNSCRYDSVDSPSVKIPAGYAAESVKVNAKDSCVMGREAPSAGADAPGYNREPMKGNPRESFAMDGVDLSLVKTEVPSDGELEGQDPGRWDSAKKLKIRMDYTQEQPHRLKLSRPVPRPISNGAVQMPVLSTSSRQHPWYPGFEKPHNSPGVRGRDYRLMSPGGLQGTQINNSLPKPCSVKEPLVGQPPTVWERPPSLPSTMYATAQGNSADPGRSSEGAVRENYNYVLTSLASPSEDDCLPHEHSMQQPKPLDFCYNRHDSTESPQDLSMRPSPSKPQAGDQPQDLTVRRAQHSLSQSRPILSAALQGHTSIAQPTDVKAALALSLATKSHSYPSVINQGQLPRQQVPLSPVVPGNRQLAAQATFTSPVTMTQSKLSLPSAASEEVLFERVPTGHQQFNSHSSVSRFQLPVSPISVSGNQSLTSHLPVTGHQSSAGHMMVPMSVGQDQLVMGTGLPESSTFQQQLSVQSDSGSSRQSLVTPPLENGGSSPNGNLVIQLENDPQKMIVLPLRPKRKRKKTDDTTKFRDPPELSLPFNGPNKFRFYCDVCDTGFTRRYTFNRHKCKGRVEKHYCQLCDKAYLSKYKLKDHILVKHQGQTVSCPDCGKRFSSRSSMEMHKKQQHEGMFSIFCKVCGKGFNHTGHYYGHMNKHNNNKPFWCQQCGKRFYGSSYLHNHKQVCKGITENMFRCPTCYRTFKCETYLKKHMRMHEGQSILESVSMMKEEEVEEENGAGEEEEEEEEEEREEGELQIDLSGEKDDSCNAVPENAEVVTAAT